MPNQMAEMGRFPGLRCGRLTLFCAGKSLGRPVKWWISFMGLKWGPMSCISNKVQGSGRRCWSSDHTLQGKALAHAPTGPGPRGLALPLARSPEDAWVWGVQVPGGATSHQKLLCPEQRATPTHHDSTPGPQPRPSSLPGVQQERHSKGTQVLRVPRGQAEEASAPGPGVLSPEK